MEASLTLLNAHIQFLVRVPSFRYSRNMQDMLLCFRVSICGVEGTVVCCIPWACFPIHAPHNTSFPRPTCFFFLQRRKLLRRCLLAVFARASMVESQLTKCLNSRILSWRSYISLCGCTRVSFKRYYSYSSLPTSQVMADHRVEAQDPAACPSKTTPSSMSRLLQSSAPSPYHA